MSVLVTGGAGHIGSHLCERLLESGHDVVCLDNFFSGAEANVAPLAAHPRFTLRRHDVSEPFDVGGVERIYNLACPASPRHYQREPVLTVRTSVLGTLHALELARRSGARVLQASTSEVYGDPEVHPQPESYLGRVNPIGPRACYDEGKRCAETLCYDFARRHGVAVRVARIFNTYGPRLRADDGRVIPTLAIQALRGEPLTVHGDGAQTRSFCYVDDLVDGLVRLMESDVATPVNLGNPEETTIRALAEMLLELTGSSSPIHDEPRPDDDPARRCPDIALAREALGWAPRTPLREGLVKTLADLQQHA